MSILKLTTQQLCKQLSDAAMDAIQKRVEELLDERIQPLVKAAAKETADKIRPVIIRMETSQITGDIFVELKIDGVKELIP